MLDHGGMISHRISRSISSVLAAAIALPAGYVAAQNIPNLTPKLDGTALTKGDVTPGDPAFFSTLRGMVITHETFSSDENDVKDNCAPPDTMLKLLRFSLDTQNDGFDTAAASVPVDAPAGCVPYVKETCDANNTDPNVVWSIGHGHYHLRDFAKFAMVDTGSRALAPAQGVKEGFAFEPSDPICGRCDAVDYRSDGVECGWSVPQLANCPDQNPKPVLNTPVCTVLQPASPPADVPSPTFANPFSYAPPPGNATPILQGWKDLYWTGLECQYVKIDGVPDGTYDFVAKVNARGNVPEGRSFDNATSMRLTISTPVDPVTCPNGDCVFVASAPVWDIRANPIAPGTGTTGAPAVVSREINGYDLFYVGADRVLYAKRQDGTSGAWSPNGTTGPGVALTDPAIPLVGPPAAVAIGLNGVLVVVRGLDGTVYSFSWTVAGDLPGYPYGPTLSILGVSAASPPAVSAPTADGALATWLGTDGSLQYVAFSGFTSSGFNFLTTGSEGGTYPTDQTPAVTASGAGMFHVFLRDATGAVRYHRFDYGTGWIGTASTVVSNAFTVVGSLAAASPYLNRVDVFARDTTNTLQWITWNGTPTFEVQCNDAAHQIKTWCGDVDACQVNSIDTSADLGDVGSSPTVITTGPNKLDLFYYSQSQPNLTYTRHYDGLAEKPWDRRKTLGHLFCVNPGVPIVASSWADNTLDIFQEFCDGTILGRSLR
jgi:hypothetical protein